MRRINKYIQSNKMIKMYNILGNSSNISKNRLVLEGKECHLKLWKDKKKNCEEILERW